ncbi:MAG: EVE domain-containing protein [Isosphaeraceae bacterium]|jgi:predicted RNA-binding protein with PUA-like domain|nr:MAG: EVE domain-containing protein [Isosphaeraceae bacterium]
MAFWLFKTEPDVFSFDDLVSAPRRSTGWDGVRNYQARNFLRDQVRVGDQVFIYHSNAEPPAIAGIAEVTRAGHPDPTAFDPESKHFDPKSDRSAPTWYQVTVRAVSRFTPPIGLPELRGIPSLKGMELLRRGSRLSVQPVRDSEWTTIVDTFADRIGPVQRRTSRRRER